MSKELLVKFRKEGPHSLSYEELLILVLGDECVEEISTLIKGCPWSEMKELVGPNAKPVPGVRNSTMDRLYAMKALTVVWFG